MTQQVQVDPQAFAARLQKEMAEAMNHARAGWSIADSEEPVLTRTRRSATATWWARRGTIRRWAG